MPRSVAAPKPALPGGLGLRLGAMFLLETGSLAAYSPLFSLYMQHGVKLTPYQMSIVYATGPVMSLLAPLAIGWVADRVLSAEKSLSLLNLLRAAALLFASRART
ncbi:MAG TPA: MFS transporter, partial [Polyangiaceae bacterium]|nr:MFS transporter [Polyangiaceae bacterium]